MRWTSCLVLAEPTALELGLGSDDGARVFVDGRGWVDGWGMHDFVVRTGKGRLDAGAHEVRVEFFDKIGPARVALWAGFGGERPSGPIPAARLRAPAGGTCR